LPYELARDLCADVGAEESLAVDLVVELHLHRVRVARQPSEFFQK
jgi:hypothetical protein